MESKAIFFNTGNKMGYNQIMPGYLTNRYISLDTTNSLEGLNSDIVDLEARMIAAEENIEDLELNIQGFKPI